MPLAQIHALQQIRGQHKDEDFAVPRSAHRPKTWSTKHLHAMQLKTTRNRSRSGTPADASPSVEKLVLRSRIERQTLRMVLLALLDVLITWMADL